MRPANLKLFNRNLVSRDHAIFHLRVAFARSGGKDFQDCVRELAETIGPRGSYEPFAVKVVNYDFESSESDLLRGTLQIAIPFASCGPAEGIPLLLAAATYASVYDFVREYHVLDFEFPPNHHAEHMPGPRRGAGFFFDSRAIGGDLLLGAVIKPRFAASNVSISKLVTDVVRGEIDYISDDELTVSPTELDFAHRIETVVKTIEAVCPDSSMKPRFIANITARYERALELARIAADAGADAVMVNTVAMGYDIVEAISRSEDLPLAVVANGIGRGIISSGPAFRIAEPVLCKLARVAGADAVYTGPFVGRIANPRERAAQYVDALTSDLDGLGTVLGGAAVMSGGLGIPEIVENARIYDGPLMASMGSSIADAVDEGLNAQTFVEVARRVVTASLSSADDLASEVASIAKKSLAHRAALDAVRVSEMRAVRH